MKWRTERCTLWNYVLYKLTRTWVSTCGSASRVAHTLWRYIQGKHAHANMRIKTNLYISIHTYIYAYVNASAQGTPTCIYLFTAFSSTWQNAVVTILHYESFFFVLFFSVLLKKKSNVGFLKNNWLVFSNFLLVQHLRWKKYAKNDVHQARGIFRLRAYVHIYTVQVEKQCLFRYPKMCPHMNDANVSFGTTHICVHNIQYTCTYYLLSIHVCMYTLSVQ